MNGQERVRALLNGKRPDRLPLMPITMMFAADRIGVPYGRYAMDHRALADGQIATAEAFGFDYVSTISDPAREAADCGAKIELYDDQPPAIDEANALLADKKALLSLKRPDPLGGGRMHDRIQGVALLRERVGKDLLVEGWIEGPCAQGADLRGINNLMLDFYDDPQFVRDLFSFIFEMELEFARAQIQAGADLIGLGDAAASLIGPVFYREFVWPLETRLAGEIRAMGALSRLHICGDTRPILKEMGQAGFDIVDLDYLSPVGQGRQAMGPDQTLLGNIDPVRTLRNGSPEGVRKAVEQCHREAGGKFIVGAGCEVCRDTPERNLRAMAEYARTAQL